MTGKQMSVTSLPTKAEIMSLKSCRGRVDLLQAIALAKGDQQREQALAKVLGYALPETSKVSEIREQATPGLQADKPVAKKPQDTQQTQLFKPYHLVTVENITTTEEWQSPVPDYTDLGGITADDRTAWDTSATKPPATAIVPWTRLWPRLRQAVAINHQTSLDIEQLTKQLSQGVAVRQLPRKSRLSWPSPVTVILDYADRLTPYWDDWHWLRRQLQTQFKQQISFYRLQSLALQQLQPLRNGLAGPRWVNWPTLNAGDSLILASDLGMLDSAHPWPVQYWQQKLSHYRRLGVRVIVLAPVSARHLQASVVNQSRLIRLSPDSSLRPLGRMPTKPENDSPQLSAASIDLLAMMSVATRVEPALLRQLRQALEHGNRDAGLEGETWCYPELNTATTACALVANRLNKWRQQFTSLSEGLQQRTLECLRAWHASLPQAVHHEETLLWQNLSHANLAKNEQQQVERARGFFIRLSNSLMSETKQLPAGMQALQAQLADHHVQWVADTLGCRETYLTKLSVAIAQLEPQRSQKGLPAGINLVDWMRDLPVITPERMAISQQADLDLLIQPVLAKDKSTIPQVHLATLDLDRTALLWAWGQETIISAYRPWLWQAPETEKAPELPALLSATTELSRQKLYLHTGQQRLCFQAFNKPDWATSWGQDLYGLYADFVMESVIQRFRWIAPGTFMMGSPESEAGRTGEEVQHQVTLTQGYWLADSACTQALWKAVMKDNPSQFADNVNNPVEQVSWEDVQQFISQLNSQNPDSQARLPTEAEWEYVCRAGTIRPFSFGNNINPAQVNYNGVYPYGDAEKGEYRKHTVPVKSLPVNPWGLYEMHGNVYEWCVDWFDDYSTLAVTDPVGPREGVSRVLRGGSWDSRGRSTRSAGRNWLRPTVRSYDIGFRLALGRAGFSSQ